jgi:anti-anti-sigma factor
MLNIQTEEKDGKIKVILEGRIDNEGIQTFQEGLDSVLEKSSEKITLDLSKLEFINSSGIGKLLIFYKKAGHSGTETAIEGISEELFSLFRAIRLDKLITIKR